MMTTVQLEQYLKERAKFADFSDVSSSEDDEEVQAKKQPSSLGSRPNETSKRGHPLDSVPSAVDKSLLELSKMKEDFQKAWESFQEESKFKAVNIYRIALEFLEDPDRSNMMKRVEKAYNFYSGCKAMMKVSDDEEALHIQESFKGACYLLDTALVAYFDKCKRPFVLGMIADVQRELATLGAHLDDGEAVENADCPNVDSFVTSLDRTYNAMLEVEQSFNDFGERFKSFYLFFSGIAKEISLPALQPLIDETKSKIDHFDYCLGSSRDLLRDLGDKQQCHMLKMVMRKFKDYMAAYDANSELLMSLK